MWSWTKKCFVAGAMMALATAPAVAQKSGGTLRMYFADSPASMSIHEEATTSAVVPIMGVFNNLVMFDQHDPAKQPAIRSVPTSPKAGLGTRTARELTFKLRQGVQMA